MNTNGQYLDHLRTLKAEMEEAMRAIGADDLAGFDESVARQEVLASSLPTMRRNSFAEQTTKQLAAGVDIAVACAEAEMARTNRQFAALLKHSRRNAAVLFALCETYSDDRKEAHGIRQKYQTWSCEM